MDNTPTAPTEAPEAPASVATPTPNEQTPAQPAVDMHGFSQDDLADMRRFLDNNGGWNAIKTKITGPKSAQPASEPQPAAPQPQAQPQAPAQPAPAPAPQGFTNDDLMAKYYFETLSQKPEYAAITKEIAGGTVLEEMANLGIPFRYPDGSWDDKRINEYLSLRAKTVPAQPTSTEPGMSNAPTVEYYQVAGDKVSNMDDAYKILQQDMQLKAMGQAGHPKIKEAEDFIRGNGRISENDK